MSKINVLLICGNLSYAGAQRQLVELAKHLNRKQFQPIVCCLSDDLELKPELDACHVSVEVIKKKFRYDFSIVFRITKLLRKHKIQIVYSFLPDANILARIAATVAPTEVTISSERSSYYSERYSLVLLQKLTTALCDVIIANSYAGKSFLIEAYDIPTEKVRVVYNGIDLSRFALNDHYSAREIKAELGIPDDALVVGMIARYKPAKNFEMFFEVAKQLIGKYPNLYFVSVGDSSLGQDSYYLELMQSLNEKKIHERFVLTGKRSDVPRILRIFDVSILTSIFEGLSNTVIESMLSGIPVVATDVGDNSVLIENDVNGFVVPINDVCGMVQRISYLLDHKSLRAEIGSNNRNKAKAMFSVHRMARDTERIFLDFLDRKKKNDR